MSTSGANPRPQAEKSAPETVMHYDQASQELLGGSVPGMLQSALDAQSAAVTRQVEDLNNSIVISPVILAQSKDHGAEGANALGNSPEPFPEYKEPPKDAIFADLMDQIHKARAATKSFKQIESSLEVVHFAAPPHTPPTVPAPGPPQGPRRYAAAASKHPKGLMPEGTEHVEESSREALQVPTPEEWKAANDIMDQLLASDHGVAVRDIDGLFSDLTQATAFSTGDRPAKVQQSVRIVPQEPRLLYETYGIPSPTLTNPNLNVASSTLSHSSALEHHWCSHSLHTDAKGRIHPTGGYEEYISFRDSAVFMEDDFAQARANVVAASSFPAGGASSEGLSDGITVVGVHHHHMAQGEDTIIQGTALGTNPNPVYDEHCSPLPNEWNEDQLGRECAENAPYDLESLYRLSPTQQARSNVLTLSSQVEQAMSPDAFTQMPVEDQYTRAAGLSNQGHEDSPRTSNKQTDLVSATDKVPNIFSLPSLDQSVSHVLPDQIIQHHGPFEQRFDHCHHQQVEEVLQECTDPLFVDPNDLTGQSWGVIEPEKTLRRPFVFKKTNLDYMDLSHIGRQETNESTVVNLSEATTPMQSMENSEGPPNPAFTAGQQSLASDIPLPITPTNARASGQHPSHGLLTPTNGALHLTLPDATSAESPYDAIAKSQYTPQPRRPPSRPCTRNEALAEAEAYDTPKSASNPSENARRNFFKFRPVNLPPIPWSLPTQQALTPPRRSTPIALVTTSNKPPVTPSSTPESPDFLTPPPPPTPKPARGKSRAGNKKAKRTVFKTVDSHHNPNNKSQQAKPKAARRSSRLVKKTPKAQVLDPKDV